MIATAHPTPSSAADSARAPASRTLELCEARQARDGLAKLLRAERSTAADFLLSLSEFDRRRGWEPLGHASLFAFLHVELGLSKGGAFFRQTAARLLQRFPDLVEPLRDGRLCITTVVELAKVVTEANRAEVVPRFFGCSSQEAREVVAALMPVATPPVRAVVTVVAAAKAVMLEQRVMPPGTPSSLTPAPMALAEVQSTEPETTHPARSVGQRDDIEPLTAELRRLHVTVSRRFLKQLETARDGLSHAIPGATTEQVLQAALDLLLEKQARARGRVKRPRTTNVRSTSPDQAPPPIDAAPLHRRSGPREGIPAAVQRAVWERDGGRCAWPLDSGGRCGSAHRLELDHMVPWAKGGESTAANLRVVCHVHNAQAARKEFGERCAGRYRTSG